MKTDNKGSTLCCTSRATALCLSILAEEPAQSVLGLQRQQQRMRPFFKDSDQSGHLETMKQSTIPSIINTWYPSGALKEAVL